MRVLWRNLPNLKNLSTLEILLRFLTLQDPKILPKFIKSIRRIRSITNLSFLIFNCSDLSQNHFNSFFHHLSKLTHLQTLKLNFDQSTSSKTPNLLHNLASLLPKLTFLTQLDIFLDGLKVILISKVSQFLQSLHNLKSLTDLTLNFKSFEILPELNTPLSTVFTHLALSPLQKVRLHLPGNIDDKCLETLSQVLMNLSSLSTLNLSMIQCMYITDKGIENLQLALSRMFTLSSLALHLPFLAKTPLMISKIASALKSLQNLIKLELLFKMDFQDLSIPGPSSNQTKELFTNLRFLKSIQFLNLHLPTRNELEDYAFEILAESLKELISLRNLFFNPGFAETLTNKGVEAFSGAIKSLTNLSGLTVFLRSNKEINEKAVDFLGNAVLNHPSLSSIRLSFMECLYIKKLKSFGTLFQTIKQMKNTSDVVVHIPYSENDGPEGKYLKEKNILKTSWLA